MRLWSLHPCYLDRQGLLAVWREALLAQKVLTGESVGYRHHPQVDRFRQADDPRGAIAGYLEGIRSEGARRGFRFDPGKIAAPPTIQKLPVTCDQLRYEWEHLKKKLRRRDPERLKELSGTDFPETHPLFVIVEGPIEPWERPI
jgi:hypothetical protein